MAPGYRLDRVLQLGQGKFMRHELEHDGAIFELGAQPSDGGCQDAPVVEAHRRSQCRKRRPSQRNLSSIAARLFDQASIVEELIAIEHLFLVPRAAIGSKTEPQSLAPSEGATRLWAVRASGPFSQQRHDYLVENLRPLFTPVLPRKEPIPGLEPGSCRPQGRGIVRYARERQIANRHHVRPGVVRPRM